MSLILEVLKCILCCEDENFDDDNESYQIIPFGISRVYNTFSNRTASPRVQLDRTPFRPQNHQQDNPNSSLIISTRIASSPRPTPNDLPIHPRVVLVSETSNPSSTGLTKGKGVERTYQESLNPTTASSSTYPKFPPPPSQRSIHSLPPLTPSSSPLKPQTSASKPSSSSVTSTSFSSPREISSTKQNLSFLNPSPTFSKPSAASISPQSSFPKLPSSSGPSSSSPNLFPSFKPILAPSSAAVATPQSSSPKPPSSSGPSSSSPNPFPSSKPTLTLSSVAVPNYPDKDRKGRYVQFENQPLDMYMIPENIKDLIKKDTVPELLKKPLSPSTYKDYFAALLYAEDFYTKKWSNFELLNVTLELQEAAKGKDRITYYSGEKGDKIFVAFEVRSPPQKRPFLLSNDSVFAQPSGRKVGPFQGVIYRVVKKTTVLVEFGEDFHSQHNETRKYDIRFSFNRVSLERAHRAIAAASDPLFQNFVFPKTASRITTFVSLIPYSPKLDLDQNSVLHQMLNFQGPPPFLVEGQSCVTYSKQLSRTGAVMLEAILRIYQYCPESKVLVCAPVNSTCDVLMRGLKRGIPDSDVFEANAAEIEKITIENLKKFRVVLSTFVNGYCLHEKDITAGHFNYIFLVDASSATEPDTMVALANLVDEKTAVIATGSPKNHLILVRSDIARKNGLRMSYFERLCQSDPYRTHDPRFISHLIAHDS